MYSYPDHFINLHNQETYGLLVQLVRQKFGTKVEIVDMKLANRRTDYAVFLATLRFPSLEIVVKLAGPRAPYPYPFDRTAMFHRLVTMHTSIPMPEILAVDVSYKEWPWRYLMKTCVPGQEWAGEGFWPAYTAVCPVADMYILRRPIYQLFWCLEYAKLTPGHLADT